MKKLNSFYLFVMCPFILFAGTGNNYGKFLQGEAAFTPNKGQVLDMNSKPVNNVLAYYTIPGFNVYITNKGVSYVMQQTSDDVKAKAPPVFVGEKKSIINYSRVDVDLDGAQIGLNQMVFSDAIANKSNYYKTSDGIGIMGVEHYKTLIIKNIYPGIDWVWKCEGNSKLQYDFIVHPGGNPDAISMNYRYADITLSGNKLLIESRYGALAEGPLQANSSNNKVDIAYMFNEKSNIIKFNVGKYNAGSDLVIDPPLVLQWSAYFGGSFNSALRGVATDTLGYIYLVGYTNSPDFPTFNAGGSSYFDGSYSGSSDAVLLKIDTAQNLKWSTFFGGGGNDYANSVAVDIYGNILVTGSAGSGFPLKNYGGAYYQSTSTGQDAFISAFASNLSLKWSTYYGGNGDDEGLRIYADPYTGYTYVTGYSNSTGGSFPTSACCGGYTQASAGGYDAFIIQLSGNYWYRQNATLYGGSGDDYATGITTDSLHNIVVSGFTTSTDFPVLNYYGGYYQAHNAGGTDGFILWLNGAMQQKQCTYIGALGNDYLTDVVTGQAGSLAFSGWTYSNNFLTVPSGLAYYQSSLAGASDALIMKFDNNLNLNWSTYYGGSDTDVATALTCDKSGRIYLTGFTFSNNFPLDSPHYAGAYYQSTNHGLSDGFLAGFSSLGVRFWSTYKGDSCYEYPNDIAYDNKFNKFYVVGENLLNCEGLPDTNQVNSGGASTIGFCWGFENTGVAGGGGANGGPPGCFDASVSGIKMPCPAYQCNGQAIVSFGTGTPPYTILWSDGENTDTATHLCQGEQFVEVEDAAGCVAQAQFTTKGLTATVGSSPVSCSGPGAVGVTVTGGVYPYNYVWSNGTHGPYASISYQDFATYLTVTVTDAAGCTLTEGDTIYNNTYTSPDSIGVIQYPTCGQNNGIVQAFIHGVPATVTWDISQYDSITIAYQEVADTLYNLGFDSTYSIDNTPGCWHGIFQNVSIYFMDSMILFNDSTTFVQQPVACLDSQGNIQLFLYFTTDNSDYFTYQWSNGQTDQTYAYGDEQISGLYPGVYSVTVTDQYGCTITLPPDTLVLTDTGFALSTGASPQICQYSNGEAWVNITNGIGPFNVSWYGYGAGDTLYAPGTAQYTAQVIDLNGCTLTDTATIGSTNDILTDDLLAQNCDWVNLGSNSGVASVSPQWGYGPYTVQWSTGDTSMMIGNLASGTYYLTVTDSLGCTITDNFTITLMQWQQLDLGPPACSFTDSVALYYNVPGASQIEFQFTGGGFMPNYPNSEVNVPSAFVLGIEATNVSQDGNGCEIDTFVNTPYPDGFLDTILATGTLGCPDSSNSLYISVTDDYGFDFYNYFPSYSYQWNTGDVTPQIYNLPPGTYSCTVTDNNDPNCVQVSSYTIVANDSFSVAANIQSTGCNTLGSIQLTIIGGVPGFTYNWSNGAFAAVDSLLPTGSYACTISDANGCTMVTTDSVGVYDTLSISANVVQNISCSGANDGSISLQVGGGSGIYNYQWSNAQQTPSDTALGPGFYNCTVTDADGCTTQQADSITQPPPLIMYVSSQNINCYNGNDGEILVTATGGQPGYIYMWSDGNQGPDDTQLPVGSYTCTITDANNCTANINTVTLIQPTQIVVSANPVSPTCFDYANGRITLIVWGGTPAYSYQWTGTIADSIDSNLTAGTYTYTVTDANGCTISNNTTLTQPDSLMAVVNSSNESCFDSANGSIHLVVSGGTGTYTYTWSNNANDSTNNLLPAGNYACTVTDGNGCVITDSFTLTQPDSLRALFTFQVPTCGSANGSLTLDSANGGTQPYSLHWSTGLTGSSLNNISSGVYYLTITDNNGCVYTLSDSVPCVTGIENIGADNLLTVYPNPASTVLYISSPQKKDYTLMLRDVTGQVVMQSYFTESAILNVANLARGVYLAEIYDRNNLQLEVKKVVLQ